MYRMEQISQRLHRKEWGYIQEQYYTHAKLPRKRKHTRKNWVVHLLLSLHSY
jgi:hypothetical protein